MLAVIGYYEAWNARSDCHRTSPEDLPHTFEVQTMDAATPQSLFEDFSSLKIANPDLKLFVSIGGWTFSDNNTYTQPIFGNIAKSSSNRQTFADKLVSFLDYYGFDGVDLDWEYPGAPDRGGQKEDTANYVLLVKTLREAFDKSRHDLGITFTAPSSYWYLKWFDLQGMMKYCNWVNLMSYDLHGTWDSTNPIGSIVQGHTNLTEIKLAAELFWRVKIPTHKISLGYGFYGRAFTLQDPSCTSPGCQFSGGAKPGVCTQTSGYLSYYEIQEILAKNPGIKVIHDEKAAVKYFTWDNNQWISYDDRDTFKQKVEWANGVGFSGSLIWASDL
ncbi:bacteriodes thetaiotaomicron symbiotic chitinase, partial [Apiospora sp. TS-2023a]